MKWYLHALRNYAVFKGRARRREYWTFELMNAVIAAGLVVLAAELGKAGHQYFFGLPFLYIVATFIPSLSSLVRRLHDTNRSGWWIFISAVPAVGPLILFAMTVMDGSPGENRFGPNPKRPLAAQPLGSPEMGYLAPPIDQR